MNWVWKPAGEEMTFHCMTCGGLIKGTVNTEQGQYYHLAHGAVQCRSCYMRSHPECPNCKGVGSDSWLYCPWCGKEREK